MKYRHLSVLMIILTLTSGTTGAQEVRLVLDAKATLGEGAIWHPVEQKLYWVDIEGKQLHIYDPASDENQAISTGEKVGTVVPVQGGGVLLALQDGIHKMDVRSGETTFVVNAEKDPGIRYNDGKCDPAGRFWVGTIAGTGEAALYRIDRDGSIHRMLDDVTVSNGIVWSADKKTMYYVDTPTGKVMAFDYDHATGDISRPRVAVDVPAGMGFPDGMTIDEEGKLWVAHWGGSCVARWDPETGELLQKIEVPGPNTTSCAFGGENLDVLYITTARQGLSEDQLKAFPLSGGVFAVKPGVRGVPADFYIEEK